jgi:multidrug efflux pump subunit AcrA (membrane-fusion protein)
MSAESSRPRGTGLFAVAGIVAVIFAAYGVASRVRARHALRQTTLEQAAPIVTVVRPDAGDPTSELVLPGNVEAFTDAAIHARTNGYVKAWYADIGTVVAKGQKLADIETPEVDQQLQQANAQLQTAIANEQLARITADRVTKLIESHAVSQQEYDNAVSAYAARRSETASARANLGRLEQLVGFERIEAPFAAPSRRATSTSASSWTPEAPPRLPSSGSPRPGSFALTSRSRRSTRPRPSPASRWS